MTDEELALAILRKVATDRMSGVIIQHGSFILDTSWVTGTDDELDLLRRLREDDHP